MKGILPGRTQHELFCPLLRNMIDRKHELALLADSADRGKMVFVRHNGTGKQHDLPSGCETIQESDKRM